MLVLLNGEIPHKPGVPAVLQQHLLLGGRGRKPEPHPNTITTTTEKEGRERRSLPGLKTGVSTPHIR
jgi:hypothetical protein